MNSETHPKRPKRKPRKVSPLREVDRQRVRTSVEGKDSGEVTNEEPRGGQKVLPRAFDEVRGRGLEFCSDPNKNGGLLLASTAQLSAALDLTPQRIRQLEQEGIVFKVARDQYDIVASVRGYITFKDRRNDLNENQIKFERERAFLYEQRGRSAKIAADLSQGNAYDGEAIDYWIQKSIEASRARILGMPNALSATLADLNNPKPSEKSSTMLVGKSVRHLRTLTRRKSRT